MTVTAPQPGSTKPATNHGVAVLVVTGGYLTEKETSFLQPLKRLWLQRKIARHAWLDIKLKLHFAELLAKRRIAYRKSRRLSATAEPVLEQYLGHDERFIPDLTEVVLATLLDREGITYTTTSYQELFSNPSRAEMLLANAQCVFASTTLLHDMSELEPVLALLNRRHNKIVLGGALVAAMLGSGEESWPQECPADIIAVGYGEFLIPALADWIRSGYTALTPPAGGRIESRNGLSFLYAGLPNDRDLDSLVRPDWNISFKRYHTRFDTIYYESVRGCPFRCSFCNYPYLFADNRFRYKSAQKIAADWQHYRQSLGVDTIVCLDSLFTVPKQRLQQLCELLIEKDLNLKWICYARADDLLDEALLQLMRAAGLVQVQIGIESADAGLLLNMNKRCSADAGGKAIDNCRRHGISTVVSLIVGFPGETAATLENTYNFLCDHPPDFYYLATFSTRVSGVPILSVANRRKFGLQTLNSYYSSAPYWQHDTMHCTEAVNHVRRLNKKIMQSNISLNGMLFYAGIYQYSPQQRQQLMQFQSKLLDGYHITDWLLEKTHAYIDKKLQRDFEKSYCVNSKDLKPEQSSLL